MRAASRANVRRAPSRPVRRRIAQIACAALALSVVDSASPGQETAAPIPRGGGDPTEAVNALRQHAADRAARQRTSVDALRSAVASEAEPRLGLPDRTTASGPTLRRFLYFTSRTCSVCDASLDDLVHGVIDRHPEVAPEVVYLGNPLIEYPEAASVFVSFADDVIARWRERLHDPAVVRALARAGKVNDTSGRVRESFATHEAETRGITEVPAFVLTAASGERVAIGRPANAEALEAALGLRLAGDAP